MILDLFQNIVLYILVCLTFVLIYVIIRINNIAKWTKQITRQFIHLKNEINKLQTINIKILKNEKIEDQYLTWLEEEQKLKELKNRQKKLKKEKTIEKTIKFLNSLPDSLDYKIGQNIIDKIGILIFLIGLALFVNISMNLNWINDYARLFFGVLISSILLITGYLLRKALKSFSNIILGGGISAIIFTFFSAYFQFHIIPLWLWGLAISITLLSVVVISRVIKRNEIALISFIAAYVAPFTVSFLKADYLIIFSYITLVNIGLLIYDYFQKSLLINIISFGFTFITYNIWLFNQIYKSSSEIPYLGAFIFLTLFYITFLLITIVNNIREGQKFHNFEFSIMMTAKAIYLSVGLIIINKADVDFQGLFVGLIGIINYTFYLFLNRFKNFDRRILNVFLSLAIMFFLLIIPIEFFGKNLTIIWAIQGVVLLFIATRSHHKPMHLTSFFTTIGSFLLLFYDLYEHYFDTTAVYEYIKPFWNRYFLSSIIVASASIFSIILMPKRDFFIEGFLKTKTYKNILALMSFVILYFSLYLELKIYSLTHMPTKEAAEVLMSIFNFSILTLVSVINIFQNIKPLKIATFATSILIFFLFVFFYQKNFVELRNYQQIYSMITSNLYKFIYIALTITIVQNILALYGVKSLTNLKIPDFFISAILSLIFLFFTSNLATFIYFQTNINSNLDTQQIIKLSHTFIYTILWSVTSLIILFIGFINKNEYLRITSILIQFVTLLKVLIKDYWIVSSEKIMISLLLIGFSMLISSLIFNLLPKNKSLYENTSQSEG